MSVKFDKKAIDSLLENCNGVGDIMGEGGLIKTLVKAVLERALEGELTEYLGYKKHDPAGNNTGNSRNGISKKTIAGDFGEISPSGALQRRANLYPLAR